jgi:hypothetical protein
MSESAPETNPANRLQATSPTHRPARLLPVPTRKTSNPFLLAFFARISLINNKTTPAQKVRPCRFEANFPQPQRRAPTAPRFRHFSASPVPLIDCVFQKP